MAGVGVAAGGGGLAPQAVPIALAVAPPAADGDSSHGVNGGDPNGGSDHYTPDNNSNNVIGRHQIQPPPTDEEKKQGYCIRQFANCQQRFICTVCGKHYTTTYNMRQHQNVHSGSGLHTCRYCGRDFTHKHVWEVSHFYIRNLN